MIRQNTKLIGICAIALLWLLAAHAVCVAQCQGGSCRVPVVRAAAKAPRLVRQRVERRPVVRWILQGR